MLSTSTQRQSVITLSVVVAILLSLTAGATSVAGQSDTDRQLIVTDTTIDPGETATLQIELDEMSDGLAGYDLQLELADDGVANITDVDYPSTFALASDPEFGPNNQSVGLEAAIADVDTASNVTLATLEIEGVRNGSTAVQIVDANVDAESGDRVTPVRESGEIAVGSTAQASTPTPDSGSSSGVPLLMFGLFVVAVVAVAVAGQEKR